MEALRQQLDAALSDQSQAEDQRRDEATELENAGKVLGDAQERQSQIRTLLDQLPADD